MKNYFFGHLAFMMLLAMTMLPQRIMAEEFTPNLFPGQAADRTAYEISATVAVGEFGQVSNTKSYVTNLTSTNQSVVQTYNKNGYTVVLIVGVGTADVTYTETMFTNSSGGDGGAAGGTGGTTDIGDVTNHTIHYTVVKGTPQAQYTYEREPVTSARAFWYGNGSYAFSAPSLEMYIKEVYLEQNEFPAFRDKSINERQCQLESSNPAVATASARGIVPVGLGETVISATWAGDDNWNGATAQYTLSVEVPKTTVIIGFAQPEITSTVGTVMAAQMPIITPPEATIDRWYSEDPEVASVDEKTGQVTMLKVGTTRIFAAVDEDETYYAAQGYYRLTVKKPQAGIYFDPDTVNVEIGVPWTRPTLLNPNNVDLANCKWYSQEWNDPVAEVTEDGSKITIKGVGTTTIYCEYESKNDDPYGGDIAKFVLQVSSIGIKVLGMSVTSLNCDDILGDGQKKVTYDKSSNKLILNNWNFDAQGLNGNLIDGLILNESERQLQIDLVGASSILNATRCIVSEQAPVVIMSEDKDNSLTLSSTSAGIQTNYLKVYDSKLYSSSSSYAIQLSSTLSVYKGGYIYATTTSETLPAIETQVFVKGKDDEGGIEILTKGVVFSEGKNAPIGFFSDENFKVPAKIIEIGKVPVTPSSDEETVISFSTKDPESNDYVVFSTSATDTYNETTGQLEITTSLTDEQVANALESLVPGSSAWVDMLPGSLVFDIPAGKGVIKINCQTLTGYSLKVKLEGKDAINIVQTSKDWALVQYDVAAPTHVVIYLHATSVSSRPYATIKGAAASAGAYIEAVKIIPEGAVEAINGVKANKSIDGKYLINGKIYIVRDGRVFTVSGMEVNKESVLKK